MYFIAARLLHKPLDPQPMIYLHESVGRGIIYRDECDGGQDSRIEVGLYNLRQIYPRKDVTVCRDKRSPVKILLGVLYATRGSQRLLLHNVIKRETVEVLVGEVVLDGLRQVAHREDGPVKSRRPQGVHHVLYVGLVAQRYHRLGNCLCYRPQPRSLPTNQGNRSHLNRPFHTFHFLTHLCFSRRNLSGGAVLLLLHLNLRISASSLIFSGVGKQG